MAKFCGKCGTKLDESTGLCPNCNKEQFSLMNTVADEKKISLYSLNQKKGSTENQELTTKNNSDNGTKSDEVDENREVPFRKKEIKKHQKKEKKQARKAKKREKRASWSTGKKIRHFLLKYFFFIVLIVILGGGTIGTLAYFDLIDIPILNGIIDKLGGDTEPNNDYDDDFCILNGNFTDIKIEDVDSAIRATQEGAKKIGLENAASDLSVASVNEVGELTYYRLQQNYEGYPVYGKTFVLVSNATVASNLTSNCFDIKDVDTNVNITQDDVDNSIHSYLDEIHGIKDLEYFEVEGLSDESLCIYTLEDKTARLAYHLYVNTDYGSFSFFVDSITSEILYCNSDSSFFQKEFTYEGQIENHTFTAESSKDCNKMYYLSNTGTKITVFTPSDGHDYDWYNDGNANIVTWKEGKKPDKSAVDAIYNLSNTYRYYKNTFSHDSFSNQGEDINVYIHTVGYRNWQGKDVDHINNAYFWRSPNGPIISITKKYEPKLVFFKKEVEDYGFEIDVIGHEFTHGVVNYTCALTDTANNKMPGAINEAIADIMGYCVEAETLSRSIDWSSSVRTSIKKDNTNSSYVYHFDDYVGHEEEHSASTIVSYAAYLMSKSGGGNLSDKEIGSLWYHSILTLPSNCTFKVLREHVEMAAQNLGFTDSQREVISNSFENVGISLDVNKNNVYGPNIDINVYGANFEIYDDYIIEITGTYNTGWFGWSWFDWFKKEYSNVITVNDTEPQSIKLNSNGEYLVKVYDGKDNEKAFTKSIKVRKSSENSQMIFTTNFGTVEDEQSQEESIFPVPQDAVQYNGHYYYLYSGGIASTYEEAAHYCESKGGYLATLTSKEENDFVYSYITQEGCKSAYFGLSDVEREGSWEWITGEPFYYSNWHRGKPNCQNSNEDYALLYYKFTDGTWNDGDFGGSTVGGENAFICEWGNYSLEQNEVSGERNIVLTLDVSGSMSGTPLEETKKASSKFINTVLEQDASIGVVTYDDESYIASNFSTDKAPLQRIVSGLCDGGGTNIEAGLRDAQRMLEKTNAKKKIIVLMSDGEPNDGLLDEELIAYAEEIKKTGTIIYTIGFFESLSEKSYAQYLMEQIASDGCHYEVADADQLTFFFEDMADQINGQKYIYVRIACPVDVSVAYDGENLDSSEENLNARTSFGTLTFEENSENLEAGIDDRVKVLRLKEGTDYDLKIVGTGHGIMNYTIGFMDENGEYSDLRKFKNIKITRRTRIDTEASNSDSSILNIDEDGDGKYDIRFKAEANGYGEEVTVPNWIIYVIIGAVVFVMLDVIAIIIYNMRKKRKGE